MILFSELDNADESTKKMKDFRAYLKFYIYLT